MQGALFFVICSTFGLRLPCGHSPEMRGRVVLILLGLAFLCGHVQAQETAQAQPVMQAQEKEPTKGLRFFYRVGRWTDDYLRKNKLPRWLTDFFWSPK